MTGTPRNANRRRAQLPAKAPLGMALPRVEWLPVAAVAVLARRSGTLGRVQFCSRRSSAPSLSDADIVSRSVRGGLVAAFLLPFLTSLGL